MDHLTILSDLKAAAASGALPSWANFLHLTPEEEQQLLAVLKSAGEMLLAVIAKMIAARLGGG